MCFHDKPVKNDEAWRGPKLREGDTLVYDEPGRCSPQVNGTGSTDYHSYHFRVVKEGSMAWLLVKHGGGQERISLGYAYTRILELLEPMPSDSRYLMLHALYLANRDAAEKARTDTAAEYRRAFVDGSLRKRKMQGRSEYRVWIEHKLTPLDKMSKER